ncbi:MAG: TlpA disulfide reductase family protein [Nitrospirota bacterium]
MKTKTFTLLIILLSGITIAFFIVRQRYSPETSTPRLIAPDIELTDIRENKLRLSELKGSVVFINFWASWCQSCIDEVPSIEGLFRRLSGTPKFTLITIIFKDDENKIFRYMKENGYTFPVYLDPDNSAAKGFGITGVPETFIVDKKGILREKVIGPADWNSPQAISLISNLISEP